MKSPWLVRCILITVMGVLGLATIHYLTCQFWANPQAWDLYEKSEGKLPDTEHMSCREVGPKTISLLTGMLATLLALHSEPPS